MMSVFYQVRDFFIGLFDTNLWPPRWYCGKWTPFHGWLYIISDLLIWSAYFTIPLIIIHFVSKRKEVAFNKVYILFAAFILGCGATHLLDAITFWYPLYRLNALMRLLTGIVSWLTIYHLIKIIPTALALRSPRELEREVEQRKLVEKDLLIKVQQLNEAQEMAKMGHWEWNIITDQVQWSEGLYKIYDMPLHNVIDYNTFLNLVYPDDKLYVDNSIKNSIHNKTNFDFHHRVITHSGEIKFMHAKGEMFFDAQGKIIKLIGTGQDVTQAKKNEQELNIKTKDLEAINEELQKFAYIASHDLQEPLRKIATFSSILQSKYSDQLDEKGKEYVGKVINSTVRMQNLIEDILSFSMLSSFSMQFEKVHLNDVISGILNDMEINIAQKNAIITTDDFPVIEGNASQLGQLFQNLISNALKFNDPHSALQISLHSEIINGTQVPFSKAIHYKFSDTDDERFWRKELFCKISIIDNGIGFDTASAEKIFELFQRLKVQTNVSGTGIGLAICKKVTENHHGQIFATSSPGKGATFTIILPMKQENFG